MDAHEELDDPVEDGDEVMDYRDRARTELDRIAKMTKQALSEHGIDLTVFFLVQSSGPLLISEQSNRTGPSWDQGTIRTDAWLQKSRVRIALLSMFRRTPQPSASPFTPQPKPSDQRPPPSLSDPWDRRAPHSGSGLITGSAVSLDPPQWRDR